MERAKTSDELRRKIEELNKPLPPKDRGEQIIPVTRETLETHSCVNQVIMQLRYATLKEEEGIELLNESIDFLMRSGYFERDGALLIQAGIVPPLMGIEG